MIGLLANLARQLPKAVKAVTSKSQQQTPMGPQPAPQTQRAPTPSLSQIVQNLGPQGFSQPRPQQTPQQPLPQMSGISQMPAVQVGTAIRQSQIPNQQNLLAELASAQRNLQSQQVSSQVPEKPGLRGLIGSLVQMSPSFNYQSPGQVLKSAPKDFMQPVATGTLKGFINSMIGIGESFQSASLAMTPWLNQQQKQGVRDLQGQRFESTSPAEGTAMFVGSVAPEVMAGNVAAATLPLRAGQGFQLGRRLQQGAAVTGAEIGTQALTGETDNLVGDTALATAANMLFPVRQAPSPGQIAGEVPTPQQAVRALPDTPPPGGSATTRDIDALEDFIVGPRKEIEAMARASDQLAERQAGQVQDALPTARPQAVAPREAESPPLMLPEPGWSNALNNFIGKGARTFRADQAVLAPDMNFKNIIRADDIKIKKPKDFDDFIENNFPDEYMALNSEALANMANKGDEIARSLLRVRTGIKLGSIVDYPEFFKAYPEAKNIRLRISKMNPYGGSFSATSTGGPRLEIGAYIYDNPVRLKEVLKHELQHFVQLKEVWGRGGSVESINHADIQNIILRSQRDNMWSDPKARSVSFVEDFDYINQLIEKTKQGVPLTAKEKINIFGTQKEFEKASNQVYRNLYGEAEANANKLSDIPSQTIIAPRKDESLVYSLPTRDADSIAPVQAEAPSSRVIPREGNLRGSLLDEMSEVQIAPPKKTKKVKKTMKDLARISDENYMQAIPDKDIGYYTRFFGSANRIIEDFFGKEGAKRWQNTIGESISKARKTFSDEWKARNSQIKEITKEYKITKKNQKDAAEFAEGNMTKADLVKKYGDKQADLIELAAKAARRLYDEGIKKLNEAEKLAGIPITKPRKDYVRHAHEMSSPAFSTWTDGIFTSRVRKGTMRPPSGKTGGESITKRRGNQSEALGLIDGLRDWNNQASKIIGFAQARKHVDDFLKFMRTTKPKGHSHTYAEMYDNFYGWLKGYSRELAGKPRNIDPLADSIRNSSVGRAIATVDSKLKGSMILGNLSSTFMNFANLPQILSALDKGIPGAGLKKLSGAVKAMFTPEGKKALTDSGWIQERYLYKESGASLNKAGSEFNRALQVFTGVGDEITVKASYLARLKDNLNEGMDYRAAVREAEEFTEKMVGGRGTAEYPELLGHPLGRLFLPFNREVVNLGEIVMKDLPKKVQENALEGAMGIVLLSGYLWLFNNAQEQIFNRRSLVDPIDLISDVAREIDRPSNTPLITRIGGRTANEALSLTPFSGTLQQLLNGLSREQKDEIFGKERFEGGFLLSRIFTTGLNALSELSDVANGDKEMSDLVTGDLARLMLMFVDSGGQIYKGLQMADVAANEGVVTNRGGDEIGRVESIFDMIRGFAGGPSSVQSVSDYYKKGEDPETFGFREREIERTETKKQKDKFLQEMYKLRKEDNREEFGKKLNENVDPSLQSEFFKDLDKFIEKQEVGRIDNVGRKLRGNLPAKQKAEALMEIGVQIGEEAFKQRVAEYDRQGLITPAVEKELMPLILQTFN